MCAKRTMRVLWKPVCYDKLDQEFLFFPWSYEASQRGIVQSSLRLHVCIVVAMIQSGLLVRSSEMKDVL